MWKEYRPEAGFEFDKGINKNLIPIHEVNPKSGLVHLAPPDKMSRDCVLTFKNSDKTKTVTFIISETDVYTSDGDETPIDFIGVMPNTEIELEDPSFQDPLVLSQDNYAANLPQT